MGVWGSFYRLILAAINTTLKIFLKNDDTKVESIGLNIAGKLSFFQRTLNYFKITQFILYFNPGAEISFSSLVRYLFIRIVRAAFYAVLVWFPLVSFLYVFSLVIISSPSSVQELEGIFSNQELLEGVVIYILNNFTDFSRFIETHNSMSCANYSDVASKYEIFCDFFSNYPSETNTSTQKTNGEQTTNYDTRAAEVIVWYFQNSSWLTEKYGPLDAYTPATSNCFLCPNLKCFLKNFVNFFSVNNEFYLNGYDIKGLSLFEDVVEVLTKYFELQKLEDDIITDASTKYLESNSALFLIDAQMSVKSQYSDETLKMYLINFEIFLKFRDDNSMFFNIKTLELALLYFNLIFFIIYALYSYPTAIFIVTVIFLRLAYERSKQIKYIYGVPYDHNLTYLKPRFYTLKKLINFFFNSKYNTNPETLQKFDFEAEVQSLVGAGKILTQLFASGLTIKNWVISIIRVKFVLLKNYTSNYSQKLKKLSYLFISFFKKTALFIKMPFKKSSYMQMFANSKILKHGTLKFKNWKRK